MMSKILLKVICVYYLSTIGIAKARSISYDVGESDEFNTVIVTFSGEVDT